MSSLSLLCLVSLNVVAILWLSELQSFCVCMLLDRDTYRGVGPVGVFPLFLNKDVDIITPN